MYTRGQKDWCTDTAIKEGYQASAIVYASIEKRAKLLASIPWRAATKGADGELEYQSNSALQKLIDRPNPDYSWYELIYLASQNLDISGNGFISTC